MLQGVSRSPAEVKRKFPQWQSCTVTSIIGDLTPTPKTSDVIHYQINTNIRHVLTLIYKLVHSGDYKGTEVSLGLNSRVLHECVMGQRQLDFHPDCFACRFLFVLTLSNAEENCFQASAFFRYSLFLMWTPSFKMDEKRKGSFHLVFSYCVIRYYKWSC